MITLYFNQALIEVQSQEFADDFKVTVRFISRLIKLLFLLLTAIFTLCKFIYLKISRQRVKEADFCFKQSLLTSVESDRTVNDSTSDSTTEDNLQEQQTDSVDRQKKLAICDYKKQLKLMKAAQLRKLCTDYFISYKNKQQAIQALLQFQLTQL